MTRKPKIPYCFSCYDKGWNSYLANEHTANDIELGEYGGDTMKSHKRYCGCRGGQRLKKEELRNAIIDKKKFEQSGLKGKILSQ